MRLHYVPQTYQKEIHESGKRFKVVIIGRRGGKTELAVRETIRAAVTKPGLYWIVAPSYRQVKSIVWTRLKQILRVDEYWKFNEQELYAEHTILNTRIELRGADNEDSLRGVGLDGVVMDECSTISANVWPEIIRPMLADRNGWALFISTPKGRNWLFDIFTKCDKDWKSWQYPTSVNKYIKQQEIDAMKADMSERLFKQEVKAEFLDDDTGVFKRVRLCNVGELFNPLSGRFYVMGVDLAKTHDFSVLTVIDSVTRNVVAFERFQDISWAEQQIKIQELALKYNNALCYIDSTGVGDPIYEALRDAGVSVDGYKFTNESKCKLVDNLAIAIEQRQITWPRELEVLTQELLDFEYDITRHGNITYGAPDGKFDDCVISLALATWGIRHNLKEAAVVEQSLQDIEPIDKQGKGTPYDQQRTEEFEFTGY